jgi:CDP-6-deoxy-D-xylo-4-hexulose-3-dehydrase
MTLPDLNWPLMSNNITREDLDAVIRFLQQENPILTHAAQVRAFEEEWSAWLGVKHSLMVNSGSSANDLTMLVLRELYGEGEVILSPLTWVSDIASVLHAGFEPVFTDIDLATLGMNNAQAIALSGPRTRAIFPTHILGYNALRDELVEHVRARGISLIEDVCESHGAEFHGRKLGTFGRVSNFSFYYAHHLSTIEGGMICTDDDAFYQMSRLARSHGLVRESTDEALRRRYVEDFPDLNPSFIFAMASHNMRSTEINGVIGRSQLPRLDANNQRRRENLRLVLHHLDSAKYFTEFRVEGSCNYAFTLVLREPDEALRDRVMDTLGRCRVEFRRGTSGGGNQLRQPYLRRRLGEAYKRFPNVDHVHFFGFYIGNFPSLEQEKIHRLVEILNQL